MKNRLQLINYEWTMETTTTTTPTTNNEEKNKKIKTDD